jgi:hypothetical protein
MSDLSSLIANCVVTAKNYRVSDYFSLELRDGVWRAETVQLTSAAMTGELRCVFKGSGPTPESAVSMLLLRLRKSPGASLECEGL